MRGYLDLIPARQLLAAPKKLILPALGVALAIFAGGCSGSTEFAPMTSQANPLDAEENDIIFQLNNFREAAGITTPVIICAALNQSASAHADDMRDKDYLTDTGLDGSTPRTRGCAAGYTPACTPDVAMAEVVALGFADGKTTFPQWTMDDKTKGLLSNPVLTVVGVGRSLNGKEPVWAMDMSSKDDPSCH